MQYSFEWDLQKELDNYKKHGLTFHAAIEVFADPKVIHLEDTKHSTDEDRYYAVGKIKTGEVATVR